MTLTTDVADATETAFLEAIAAEIRRQATAGCPSLCVERLLAIAPWSRRQMERLFRDHFLTSPARFFRDCQWEIAEQLLLGGKDVLTVTTETGFASPGRLHDGKWDRNRHGLGIILRGILDHGLLIRTRRTSRITHY